MIKRILRKPALFLLIPLLVLFSAGGYFWLFRDLPKLDTLPERLYTPSVRIVDRNGKLLYEAIDPQGGRHTVVPLDAIPLACRQATIATEDRSFYDNPGVDPRGVLRAVWINLRGGGTLAGGSTITQQVARNLLLGSGERSLRRKLREVVLAWDLTQRFSKDEILSLYLNQTYYGGLSYGIEAASQTFFGKPVGDLDLAQCAILAGMPQAPALYNPFTDLAAAKRRQEIVLHLMETDGFISSEQSQLAAQEQLNLAENAYPIEAPHFVMMVRSQVDALFTPEQIYNLGGLVVRTTLDLDWQKLAERSIQRQLDALAHTPDGLGRNVNNAALVALDPSNGDVLALVGSPDYFDAVHGGAINMAISPRQPGSALKPLVYAAALDPKSASGGWTAATMILDVSSSFLTYDGKAYAPANYDLKEHGPVLVRQALASSLNIPAVKTLQHVGLESLFDLSKKMGVSTLGDPKDYDLSLALGGGAVRLLDLTGAYGAFASGGFRVEPRLILEAHDFEGRPVYTAAQPARTRVLDERIAWLISDILSDNEARRLGFGGNSILRLDRPAAVKTGTTSNFHDNWTVGYTPDLVVGVWSGNTDYEPMREVNGLSGAAPIWHEFMRTVLAGRPELSFQRPPGMTRVEVCALSGMLPTDACRYRRTEWFIDGTQPVVPDSLYREVTLDSATGNLADANTPPERWEKKVVLDLPPEAQPWAHAQGLTLYGDLLSQPLAGQEPSLSPRSVGEASLLKLLAPSAGSTFRLVQGFSRQAQRIQLEAAVAPGISQVTFWVDGVQIGEPASAPYQAWWDLAAGDHHAWVEGQDAHGQVVSSPVVDFSVIQ